LPAALVTGMVTGHLLKKVIERLEQSDVIRVAEHPLIEAEQIKLEI
jgi:hypothetical protein